MSTTYEDTNRPNVIIDEPHPGTFVIRGHNPNTIDTDEGRIVPLPECYVAPEVPTSALQFILAKRSAALTFDERVRAEISEVRGRAEKLSLFIGNHPAFPSLPSEEQERLKVQNDVMWQYVEVLESRVAADFKNAEKAPVGDLVSGLTPEEIESLVIEALAKNDGTMRIGPLSQAIMIPDEEIKAASKFEPCRFEIVSGGWVKLKKEGAE